MKCLRCRKDTGDNSSFCDECLKTVSVPLAPSPYLNTQINLSAIKKHRAMHASVTNSSAAADQSAHSIRALRITVFVLCLLCLALAAGCLWFSRDLWLAYLR